MTYHPKKSEKLGRLLTLIPKTKTSESILQLVQKAIDLLLEGAYPNMVNESGDNLLLVMAKMQEFTSLPLSAQKIFFEQAIHLGVDMLAKNYQHQDMIGLLVSHAFYIEVLELLANKGADISTLNTTPLANGEYFLHNWVLHSDRGADSYPGLLPNLDYNIKNHEGLNVLAACYQNKKIEYNRIKTLIELGADPLTVDQQGNNGMHLAIQSCPPEYLQYYIGLGFDLTQKNKNGFNVLELFLDTSMPDSHAFHSEAFEALLTQGNLNLYTCCFGESPLHSALRYLWTPANLLKAIEVCRADIDHPNAEGLSGLACYLRDRISRKETLAPEIVKAFLKAGANPSAMIGNETCLHHIIRHRAPEHLIEMLATACADLENKNCPEGLMPIELYKKTHLFHAFKSVKNALTPRTLCIDIPLHDGGLICDYLEGSLNLPADVIQTLGRTAGLQEMVFKHIQQINPLTEQKKLIEKALDPNEMLHQFFKVQKNALDSILMKGYIRQLRQLQQDVNTRITEEDALTRTLLTSMVFDEPVQDNLQHPEPPPEYSAPHNTDNNSCPLLPEPLYPVLPDDLPQYPGNARNAFFYKDEGAFSTNTDCSPSFPYKR